MSIAIYLTASVGAALASLALAGAVIRIARKYNIVDRPDKPRKIHGRPIPLLGGSAIFVAFWLVILLLAVFTDALPSRYVAPRFLWGIFIAGAVLMVGGYLDDRYRLAPKYQIIFPVLAALVIIGSGIGVNFVSHPFGEGLLRLDRLQWDIGVFAGRSIRLVLVADLFTAAWLLGMMYTTKFLDGLDGLVSGITVIGAFILFALSLSDKTFQPDIALLAIALSGAALGFLFLNTHPAKIFLGEGGSIWLGFMLGVLAIISGGKVATALLVMGIPVLDVAWVIIRRAFLEKHSPAIGDAKHLHFRLLTAGLSHRASVLALWGLSALFGVASLFVQTQGKVYLLAVLALVMFVLAIWSTKRSKQSRSPEARSSS